jgi:metalloendopeptidase OMA1, mitochondrial
MNQAFAMFARADSFFPFMFSCRISDAAASVFNFMNNYLAERAFSRKLEEEADALGLEANSYFSILKACYGAHALSCSQFMAKAGYDPHGALDLWDVMAAVESVIPLVV